MASRFFGTPLGHRAQVEAQLQRTVDDHQQLLDRIPLIHDLQSLLLLFCASTRTNHFLRVVHPSASEPFAQHHDTGIWQCFSSLLGQLPHRPTLGSGSPECSAHCPRGPLASWADCLPVIKERHGGVVRAMVAALHDPPEDAVHLRAVVECRLVLAGVGHDMPEWQALADRLRPRPSLDPGTFDHGWKFFTARAVEERFSSAPSGHGFLPQSKLSSSPCLPRPRSVCVPP